METLRLNERCEIYARTSQNVLRLSNKSALDGGSKREARKLLQRPPYRRPACTHRRRSKREWKWVFLKRTENSDPKHVQLTQWHGGEWKLNARRVYVRYASQHHRKRKLFLRHVDPRFVRKENSVREENSAPKTQLYACSASNSANFISTAKFPFSTRQTTTDLASATPPRRQTF